MADEAFESLVYENAQGVQVTLSDPEVTDCWELRGRYGFTAPTIELITQKYVNGSVKIVGRIVQPRTCGVNMVVVGDDREDRDTIFFDMVEKLLDVDGGDVGKLYITRSDGTVVILNCAYSSGLSIADEYRKFHRFTLEFYAEDPYFYSSPYTQEIDSIEADIITLAQDLYLGMWSLGTGTISGTGTITNPTGQNIEPIYSISGVRSSLVIKNNTTNQTMAFYEIETYPGDTIIIDTREKIKAAYIKKANGSIVSIMDKVDWTNEEFSLPLVPGANNISVSGYGEEAPLVVDIMERYLSA